MGLGSSLGFVGKVVEGRVSVNLFAPNTTIIA